MTEAELLDRLRSLWALDSGPGPHRFTDRQEKLILAIFEQGKWEGLRDGKAKC